MMKMEANLDNLRRTLTIRTEVMFAQGSTVVSLWEDHQLGVNARQGWKFGRAK